MSDFLLDTIIHGDALEVLKTFPDNSVDAICCDPPAGISFMGKDFDSDRGGRVEWIVWLSSIMKQALRCLKPGGHALVWALPRTSHWTGTALERAGFEVRDAISHIFGTGFPKSKNLGEGRGTALKPSHETWLLCRKPLAEKTIAENVLKHGTGGLNIDACRIGTSAEDAKAMERCNTLGSGRLHYRAQMYSGPAHGTGKLDTTQGRFPSNTLLSHSIFCNDGACDPSCPVKVLDEMSGISKSTGGGGHRVVGAAPNGIYGNFGAMNYPKNVGKGDTGTASRYFAQFSPDVPFIYAAKASKKDRSSNGAVENTHPTCKSQQLMRYLVRMICKPGGVVLDCFCGSGSTLVAAIHEGMHFIGVEQLDTPEEPYVTIARARVERAFADVRGEK